ncbi:MAG: hypothetical protein H6845_00650 [Alphaproteobacteria bacterium]|nr:MAG: hypothetical protein H6845_00650 [Alphaproteobacteria bacterium]
MCDKYLLIGFGLSNQSAAEILSKHNLEFYVWDDDSERRQSAKIHYHYKIYDGQKINKIVLSPGVRNHRLLPLVNQKDILNEVELFLQFTTNKNIKIACTGSFGKSTTVSLIAYVINHSKKFTNLAKPVGNIGTKLSEVTDDIIPIIELSSFQLEKIYTKNINIGVILNIAKHHLEYYSTFQEYYDAKYKIIDLSTVSFINRNLPTSDNSMRIIVDDRVLMIYREKLKHISQTAFEACYVVCRYLGIEDEIIFDACKRFTNLPHRQEIISFNPLIINDSKSTNLECSAYALQRHVNALWIAGGKTPQSLSNKTYNFTLQNKLLQLFQNNIQHAFFFGSSKQELSQLLNSTPHSQYETLEDVVKAIAKNYHNETIVFSPGFQSFDQFSNFEERGDIFKELIKKYLKI